jgi:hypothetical protein
MPREWTDEQRKEAGERLAKGRTVAPPHATVPTANELFLAQQEINSTVTTNEAVANTDGAATAVSAERKGPKIYGMYKKGDYGSLFVRIPYGNLAGVLGSGNYTSTCPECGGFCQQDGSECPAQANVPFRRCPVPSCARTIKDAPPVARADTVEESAAEIKDGAFVESTPELRTKSRLQAHMAAYHKDEYAAYAGEGRATSNLVTSQAPVVGRTAEVA